MITYVHLQNWAAVLIVSINDLLTGWLACCDSVWWRSSDNQHQRGNWQQRNTQWPCHCPPRRSDYSLSLSVCLSICLCVCLSLTHTHTHTHSSNSASNSCEHASRVHCAVLLQAPCWHHRATRPLWQWRHQLHVLTAATWREQLCSSNITARSDNTCFYVEASATNNDQVHRSRPVGL